MNLIERVPIPDERRSAGEPRRRSMVRSQAFRSRDNDGAARTLHLNRKEKHHEDHRSRRDRGAARHPGLRPNVHRPGPGTSGHGPVRRSAAARARRPAATAPIRAPARPTTGSTGTGTGSSGTMGGQSGTTMPHAAGPGHGLGQRSPPVGGSSNGAGRVVPGPLVTRSPKASTAAPARLSRRRSSGDQVARRRRERPGREARRRAPPSRAPKLEPPVTSSAANRTGSPGRRWASTRWSAEITVAIFGIAARGLPVRHQHDRLARARHLNRSGRDPVRDDVEAPRVRDRGGR